MSASDLGFKIALEEAEKGYSEGGVPIGACLVSEDGQILGRGHNMRVQKGSPTLHAEIAALEDAGRLPASVYQSATMYTTLSPCEMCTGACVLYQIGHVVIGEHENFLGGETWLQERGIKFTVVDDEACKNLMRKFMKEKPGIWNEDIGKP